MAGRYYDTDGGEREWVPYREDEDTAYERFVQRELDEAATQGQTDEG